MFEIVATAAVAPTEYTFNFVCDGAASAPVSRGVNTFLFSASTSPVIDLLSIASVLSNDGITNVPGTVPTATGIMSVAAVNIGTAGSVTATATLSRSLPVSLSMCQTNPATAQCLAPPSTAPVTSTVGGGSNSTPITFAIFVNASQRVALDPESARIVMTFRDSDGAIRGQTSTAVRTRDIILGGTNPNGVWTDVQNNLDQVAASMIPGVDTAPAAAALKAMQNNVLFSDLRDLATSSADQLHLAIACIYLKVPDENQARTLANILTSSVLSTKDRLNGSIQAAGRTSGVVFQKPDVTLADCP